MKYTKKERLEIGKRIYNKELTIGQAAEKYNLNYYTARDYLRMYKAHRRESGIDADLVEQGEISELSLEALNREELINLIIKMKVDEERLKKGYLVKGDGIAREFISISQKNMRL